MSQSKFKVIISDCHLSAGRVYENRLNPHEDFHYDEEMVEFFQFFSSGKYGIDAEGPIDVELILAGDFLDPLNVPFEGEFEEAITEKIALEKLEAILAGHPEVSKGLREFAALPGKRITYLIGNHDADLFFESVRNRIIQEWDPNGQCPSEKVKIIADTDRIYYSEGVEVRHGNQFEAGSILSFAKPLLTDFLDEPVLNIPWGSIYVLKIINRLKGEREYIDKVRPVKVFVLFGLLIDTWFTLRFCALSIFYFLKTRFVWSPKRRSRLRVTLDILRQETRFFLDLEQEARQVLDERQDVKTLIFGHTHAPLNRVYPDGKQYINTGTWTKMINLDWRGIGSQAAKTFALVELKDGKAVCDLRQWVGEHLPHSRFER